MPLTSAVTVSTQTNPSYNYRQNFNFCFFCGKKLMRSSLYKHCRLQHRKGMRGLHPGEEPRRPRYLNHKDYINSQGREPPLPDPEYVEGASICHESDESEEDDKEP